MLKSVCSENSTRINSCVARTDTWKRNRKKILKNLNKEENLSKSAKAYYNKIVPIVYSQGLFGILGFFKKIFVSIVGVFRVIPREPTSNSDMRVWAHKTTALACENLMLALRAYGYDSCPMEGMDSKKIKSLLKLPSGAEICMVKVLVKELKMVFMVKEVGWILMNSLKLCKFFCTS